MPRVWRATPICVLGSFVGVPRPELKWHTQVFFLLIGDAGVPCLRLKWHAQVRNDSWRAMPSTPSGTLMSPYLAIYLGLILNGF
ncbi:hypothetical protein AHAS_Ahas07G0141200 [Arachis hypogaea]